MPDPAGEPWEFLEAHGLEPGGQAPEKHDGGGDFGAEKSPMVLKAWFYERLFWSDLHCGSAESRAC